MIILASKSPRRRELLKYITDEFEIKSAEVDEALPDGISPEEAVKYLSKIKAEPFRSNDDLVIGADTIVSLGERILGKPRDKDEARQMLSELSGREHIVYTGVTILNGERELTFAEATRVKFHKLSEAEIEKYIATDEPMDKAGAYGIQGYGALLVEGINCDYFNVVGLPVSRLNQKLRFF